MTDENPESDNDVYVIEDTGESLDDFAADSSALDLAEHQQEPGASGEAPVENVSETEQVQRLREENEELRAQYLRSRADFENFRKRLEREKGDYFKYALSRPLEELLPVIDNFERGLSAGGGGEDFRTGVELIYKQLMEIVQKLGVTPVETENAVFDPTMHEAVMREDDPSVPANTILRELQKGYFLHDRLLRPALVSVAVGGPEAKDVSDEEHE